MRRRHVIVAVAVVLLISALVALPARQRLNGLSIDLLFWLRHHTVEPQHDAAASQAVVVAIDEESYRREPFRELPKVMWTKQLAAILEAILGAGAKVVGFDVVYPTSVERYLKGFDRELLVALRRGAREGRVVLGKVQHQYKPISPFAGYSYAVGHARNIRSLNVFTDSDGVIRRVPLYFRGLDGEPETSLSLELAARASGQPVRPGSDGEVLLAERTLAGVADRRLLLDFDTAPAAVPTFSFADLHACAAQGRSDFFARYFSGKVVIVGAVLDVEDRKLTSQRFVPVAEPARYAERCVYPVMSELYTDGLRRSGMPGVYLHAQAVNNLLGRGGLREIGPSGTVMIVLLLSGLVAVTAMTRSLMTLAAVFVLGTLAWVAIATAAFAQGVVLPLLAPPLAAGVTLALLFAYRFAVADREKRHIRRAFSLYLPRAVVDGMVDSDQVPALGGELRELTILFSDLANFTALSERLAPDQLVQLLNSYLSEMTRTIEEHGGFVDKYVGDAIVAVFGAPLADPEHPAHAIAAALSCQERLLRLNLDLKEAWGIELQMRIGLNSGEVLIGNIGSERRFNYTVMGDAVNLASRLEGANKFYGTRILASEKTALPATQRFVLRELDLARVVGRAEPVRLFEPLGAIARAPEDSVLSDRANAFASALAAYRARRFEEAEAAFRQLVPDDPVSARFVEYCRHFTAVPPPADWDAVTDLTEK